MLFDEKPKSTLEEFFDRREELEDFVSSLDKRRMIVVKGIRRIGKSSLVRVGLNLSGLPHIYTDFRGLVRRGKLGAQTLLETLSAFTVGLGGLEAFMESVRRVVEEISLPVGVRVRLRREESSRLLLGFFKRLDEQAEKHGVRVVVALDEAQLLRYSAVDVRGILANVYDNMDNLTLVLAGSEVGLLADFIGVEDPESPLYGRYIKEIELGPFPKQLSLEFLRRGFDELGMRPPDEFLESAVDKLDGIVGWLTYLGLKAAETKNTTQKLIEQVLELATQLELRELSALPESQRRVLAAASKLSEPSWSDIKSLVQATTGRSVNDAEINRALSSLQKLSLIQKTEAKRYVIPDPVTRRAASKLS